MKILTRILVLILAWCVYPSLSYAHHTGNRVSGGSIGGPKILFLGDPIKPTHRLYFVYDGINLDESLGQIHTLHFGGEYSVTPRLSLMGDIPIVHIAHNYQPNQTGLGDIAIQGKFLIWETKSHFAYLRSQWSLPTGNEDQGLGRGALAQEITGLIGFQIGEWILFTSTGFNFGYESNAEPIWIASLGVHSKQFLKDHLAFILAVTNELTLSSDVLKSGSSKLYLEPGVSFFFGKNRNWSTSLLNRVSIVDTLERKPNTALSQTDSSFFNDILWGMSFNLNYQF